MKSKTLIIQPIICTLLAALTRRSCVQLMIALAILCCGSMEHAQASQTDTWSGAGADNNWNTAANWDNAVTTGGDDLIFPTSAKLGPVNNFTGLQIDSITLNATGYVISGNALTITNGITDNAGSNTISIPLALGASQTFQNNAAGTTNTESGTIAMGNGESLTIGGSGFFFLNGIVSATNGGTLIVNNSGVARLGPTASSSPNTFGTNTVVTTTINTNTTFFTNVTFLTNQIVNGTPVIITNTVITTNNVFTFVTNAIFNVADAVIVQAGTLQFGGTVNGNHIPNGPSVGNVLVNGTLDMNGVASETINGLEGGGIVDNVNPTLTGVYTLTVGNGDSNAVFSGTIQNTAGSIALTKTGNGTETLNGNNTYSGQTTINQGNLVIGPSGTLGLASRSMVIAPGGVLDVTALGTLGYQPQNPLNLNAGTTTKPFTNFFGSFNPTYPNFIVTQATNTTFTFTTNLTVVPGVSTNINFITTNSLTTVTLSSNSIVSVINADVNGNFNLFGGSFTPVAPAPGFATFTVNGNLNLDNSLGAQNNLNFLLNNITNAGGGLNDLIDVKGTLNIGDTVNIVVSPALGTLATGKYTLMTSANFVSGGDFNGSGPANFVVIAPRGVSGTIDTSDGKDVFLSASGTANPGSIVWAATNAANDTWNIHVSQNWKVGAVPDFFFSLDNVTFDDTGFGTVNLFGPVTPGSMTFNNNNTNYAFNASSENFIAGGGGITLNGSGTVTLNNPNAFTGPTTINGSTLVFGSYGGFGNVTVYNGVPPNQLVFGAGNGAALNAQAIANTSQSTAFSGLTLNPGANARVATTEPRGSTDTGYISFGGNINRSVGSSLYINFTLKGGIVNNGVYFTNTLPWTNGLLLGGWAHTGTDWLQAQTNFGAANPANGLYNFTGYAPSNNPAFTVATWVSTNNISISNSTAAVTASATINTLKLSGPATVTISAGQVLTTQTGGLLVSSAGTGASTILGGTLKGAPGADLIVLQNLTTLPLTIGSIIADNGSATALTLGGLGGTLILTNNNTYTGTTYINAGSLQVGAGAALGSIATSSGIIDNGGTLSFNRPDSTSVGAVSGKGGIIQLGTGTLTLAADNTLAGLVTVSAGTLQVGNGGAVGSISNITSVVDSGTLVFNNSGTLGYAGVISGIGSVVQNGSGTLILKTNETYVGNTTVGNGTLALSASGSISNTPAIVVNAGAIFDASAAGGLTLRSAVPSEILAGSGTINGSLTTAGGTKVTPGTNGVIGTLTFNNNLNLNGGNLVFDIVNSGASDQIRVAGVLNENAGNVLVSVVGTPLVNGLYPLIYATNGVSGAAANLVAIGFLQSGQLAVLTNSTPNELDLLVFSGIAPSLTWQGDGSQNIWDTTISSKWLGGLSYQQGDFVTFDDSGSASPAVNLNIVEFPASVTVSSTANNYTFGVNGGSGVNKISGGATLTKSGSSTLTLQTVNDYSGGTAINGGVVKLNGDGGANDDGMVGSGNVVNNGTLIANNANTETLSGNLTGNGPLIQQGVGALVLAGNNTAFAGPITLSNILQVGNGASGTLGTGNVTNNGSLVFNLNSPNNIAVNANISGSGGITNVGTAVTTLNGTDTYAGITAIPAGKVAVGSASAIPVGASVVLNDSGTAAAGTLDLNGFNISVANLSGTNTGAGTASFSSSRILNNGSGTNTITFSGGVTNTFYGQIIDHDNGGTGRVALNFLDGANYTLSPSANNQGATGISNNTFSGAVTISNATVSLGIAIGTATVGNGVAGSQTWNGGTGPYTMVGTNALLHAWSEGNGVPTLSTTLSSLTVPSGQTGTLFGPPRGTVIMTLKGGGNLFYSTTFVRGHLGGDFTAFNGTLTFIDRTIPGGPGAGGDLAIDTAAFLPNAAVIMQTNNISTLIVYGSTTAGNGAVLAFGSLAGGDNTVQLAGSSQNTGANVIYAIGGLNTSTAFGGQIFDGVGIRKVGTGTLTLTNTILSYGGQTVVSNGTLAFVPTTATPSIYALTNNYLVGTNFTLVAPGILDVSGVGGTLFLGHNGVSQTIYGNGTLNGSLVVSNLSQIVPGRRVSPATGYVTGSGLQVTGSVTMLGGSTNIFSLNRTNILMAATANDSLTAASIAYGGTLIVTNTGDTAFANGSTNVFHLFNGAISGTFASVQLPVVPVNLIWVNNLNVDGTLTLINTNAASVINPNPPVIQSSFSGSQLTLAWPTNLGWILQSQTNPLGVGLTTSNSTWFDIAGSASQTNAVIPINATNPAVFFRLRSPP